MKKYSYTIAVLVFMLVLNLSVWATLEKDEKLEPFSLKSIEDKIVTVKNNEGKLTVITEFKEDGKKIVQKKTPDVVLLDFWGTWCGPCRIAMPYLQKLYDKYKPKDEQEKGGLIIIGIALEKGNSLRVKAFAKKQKIKYPLLAEPTNKSDKEDNFIRTPNQAKNKYQIQFVPTMYILDSKGIIKNVHIGLERDFPVSLENEIKEMIPQKETDEKTESNEK